MQPTADIESDAAAPPREASVESVLYALMTIGRLMRQRMHGDAVDPGTFFLLKRLADRDAMRVTELAALANLDASTMSRHVAQLHRSGLIERTQDPDDGRAQRVAVSEHGRELLNISMIRRRAVLGKSVEDWDSSELETLGRLLGRIVHNIEHNIDEHDTELEQA